MFKSTDRFFNKHPTPMIIYEPADFTIYAANKSALNLYDYSKSNFLSLSLKDLWNQDQQVDLAGRGFKETIEHDENKIHHHCDSQGEPLYVSLSVHDIEYKGEQLKLLILQNESTQVDYRKNIQMIYENSLDGIMLTKPNGEILNANQAACEMLNMSEEEIREKGRDQIVAKDDKLDSALKQRRKTDQFSGELTFLDRHGRKIPVEVSTIVFENADGERRTSLIFRDISKRKKTENELRQEKEFTDIISNSIPGIFFVIDKEGKTIRWNQNSLRVFGLSPEEMSHSSVHDFVYEEDKERVNKLMATVFEGRQINTELKIKTPDDYTPTYQVVARSFKKNGKQYIVGSGVDITQQKNLEKRINKLLEEETRQRKKAELDLEYLQHMFEQAPSPKCVLEGSDLRYSIANESYREVVGQEDVIGKKLTEVIPEVEEQGYVDIIEEVMESGEPYVGVEEKVRINKSDSASKQNYVFNLVYQPLFDEQGDIYGIFGEGIDLSDLLSEQEKLEQSLEEKEALLSEVHHRVKNNLAIICSLLQMQAMESTDKRLQNSLSVSEQRVQTIATIHELLYTAGSFANIDFGENIRKLIDNISNLYDSQNLIEVEIQNDPVSLNINQAIPCALIINEIVTNSYRHAFAKGEFGQISVNLSANDETIQLEIGDNGKGLPENFSSDRSGLGTTLIHTLKDQLNANLELSNDNGTHYLIAFERAGQKGASSTVIG